MDNSIKHNCKRSQQIIDEAIVTLNQKTNFLKKYDFIHNSYMHKKILYSEYEKQKYSLLGSRSKKEWISFYDSYLYELYNKILFFNQQIFYRALLGDSKRKPDVHKAISHIISPEKIKKDQKKIEELKHEVIKKITPNVGVVGSESKSEETELIKPLTKKELVSMSNDFSKDDSLGDNKDKTIKITLEKKQSKQISTFEDLFTKLENE